VDVYYFDTSAAVKYYLPEAGSSWIIDLVDEVDNKTWRNAIVFSKIAVVEGAAAIAKWQRMGQITVAQKKRLVGLFLKDCADRFQSWDVDDEVVELATDLTQRHPLRGYDAMHLATALILNRVLVKNMLPPLTFVAADDVLCEAAKKEKLLVENPNQH
jgi:predicted nucleic acid-binding protein